MPRDTKAGPKRTRGPEARPTVAVGGIVFDQGGRVLLIRRARPPHAGRWSVPGGKVSAGETLAAAVARELREETGLLVEVGPLALWLERIVPGFHYVILDFLARPSGGALAAGDDAAEARWFDDDELAGLATTPGLGAAIAHARRVAAGLAPPRQLDG